MWILSDGTEMSHQIWEQSFLTLDSFQSGHEVQCLDFYFLVVGYSHLKDKKLKHKMVMQVVAEHTDAEDVTGCQREGGFCFYCAFSPVASPSLRHQGWVLK